MMINVNPKQHCFVMSLNLFLLIFVPLSVLAVSIISTLNQGERFLLLVVNLFKWSAGHSGRSSVAARVFQ